MTATASSSRTQVGSTSSPYLTFMLGKQPMYVVTNGYREHHCHSSRNDVLMLNYKDLYHSVVRECDILKHNLA